MEFPYPLFVCDIGGTNTRIGAVVEPGAALDVLAKVKTAAYPGLVECIEDVLSQAGCQRPRSIVACGAGPVAHRRLHLTNAGWTIDGPQTAYRLGLSQGILLNDFEAQALSLPSHRPGWVHTIGPDLSPEAGPRIILGPGTGLGVAALIDEGSRFLPLASEAAHTELGPVTLEDLAVWPHLERSHGRLTAETLLSGPGLSRLHEARQAGAAPQAAMRLGAAEIVARALAQADGPEGDTVRHFWRLMGRFAGDMALIFLARGGVYLSGGVLPRIIPLLDPAAFRSAFEDKAPMSDLVCRIPTAIVTAPDAVLAGMAAVAAQPMHYQLDYGQRAWR